MFRARILAAILLAVVTGGCDVLLPTEGSDGLLVGGRWIGYAGNFDVVIHFRELDGRLSGEMFAAERVWTISGNGAGFSATPETPTSVCDGLGFDIEKTRFARGRLWEMSGSVSGRCYGMVIGRFELERG